MKGRGEALELNESDRRERLQRLAATVATDDVFRWAEQELAGIEQAAGAS